MNVYEQICETSLRYAAEGRKLEAVYLDCATLLDLLSEIGARESWMELDPFGPLTLATPGGPITVGRVAARRRTMVCTWG